MYSDWKFLVSKKIQILGILNHFFLKINRVSPRWIFFISGYVVSFGLLSDTLFLSGHYTITISCLYGLCWRLLHFYRVGMVIRHTFFMIVSNLQLLCWCTLLIPVTWLMAYFRFPHKSTIICCGRWYFAVNKNNKPAYIIYWHGQSPYLDYTLVASSGLKQGPLLYHLSQTGR